VRLDVDIASKTFRNAAGEQHDVVAGVAFALDAGEVGVFVGPSGAKFRERLPGLVDVREVPGCRSLVEPVPGELVDDQERCKPRDLLEAGVEVVEVVERATRDDGVELVG